MWSVINPAVLRSASAAVRNRIVPVLAAGVFASGIAATEPLGAEPHVVSSAALKERIRGASEARQERVRDVQRFLSSKAVEKNFAAAGLDAKKVRNIVPALNDSEIERLAERTRGIERDLKAGALTNQELTYIVIALGTAIVVILAS